MESPDVNSNHFCSLTGKYKWPNLPRNITNQILQRLYVLISILATVVILNLANYSHWVAFPSIAKNAAKHYDQSGERMDLIPTVSYGLGKVSK